MAKKKNVIGRVDRSHARQSVARSLPDGTQRFKLQADDGTDFGKVTYTALKAINSGTLDTYKPKDKDEENVISQYRGYKSIPLSTENGIEFGNVSYDAYLALSKGDVGNYKPKDADEQKVIDDFKNTIGYGKTVFDIKDQYDKDKFGKGNIDLTKRPIYTNADGKISTVSSMSINEDGKEILIPTIVQDANGKAKQLTEEEAIDHYHKTGEHLGKFDSISEANKYAQRLHVEQDLYYDFVRNSQYKPTKNGKKPKKIYSASGDGTGAPARAFYTETGFDDIEHDYINGNQEAIDILTINEVYNDEHIAGIDSQFLKEMYPEEKATYNYIYNVYGKDKAKEYIKSISSDLNLRQRLNSQDEMAKYAREHEISSSVATVLMSPLKAYSAMGQLGDYLDDGKIDQNAGYNHFVYNTNAVRSAVSDEIKQTWAGDVGAFLYQAGMSMGDSAMNTAVTGGNKFLSLGLMGAGAFADTVVSSKDRGLSDDQAMGLGLVAAIAEIFTENFSWNKLFGAKSAGKAVGKSAITSTKKYILDNMKTNALEEMGADAINFVADVAIAKDKSQWQEKINGYKKQGYSDSKAWGMAFKDVAFDMARSGLAGALSGGVMSGSAGMYINSQIKQVGKDNSNNVLGVIGEGLGYDQKSEAYKNALKLATTKSEISDYDVGRQVLLNSVQATTISINEGLKHDKNSEAYKNARKLLKSENITSGDLAFQTLLNSGKSPLTAGDQYLNSKTNSYIKVVSRDDDNTTIEFTRGDELVTKVLTNAQADTLFAREYMIDVIGSNKDVSAESNTNVTTNTSAETNGTPVNVPKAVSTPSNVGTNVITEAPTVSAGEQLIDKSTNNVIEASDTSAKNIHLKRVGKYYEVYGEEAKLLAAELDLETTKVVVNGVESDMLRLPADLTEKLASTIGDEFNLVLSDKPISTEDKNATVTDETTSTDEVTPSAEENATEVKISDVANAVEETLTEQAKVDLQNGEVKDNYVRIAETLAEVYNASGTIEAFADFFVDGGKKVEATIKGETDNSAEVLKNESTSDTIESSNENDSVERKDDSDENERSERTVEERTVHNDENVERTDGERTGRSSERVSGKTGNAQKTETERTTRKKVATATFDEVKRDYYTPEMKSLEKGTYDKYGVVVKYFYGECIDDSGAKGDAFYYNGVLYIQADAETSLESRIDHEITHHFGKSNAMTKFRNAVKAKMPKAEYDSWYAEIKEAYGDVLVRYLSKELKNSNYTLTDAELQQLMDEYIEEEMLANLNGEQVPFATEYRAEIEAFRKEIGNYNTKSKATSESKTSNTPAEYSESIDAGGNARYSLFPGGVFPPYNKSHSDANERATRWAHNEDIETGAQRIFFYKGTAYLVEKFDSMDLGYLVMKKISKKSLSRYERNMIEYEKRDNDGGNNGPQSRRKDSVSNNEQYQGFRESRRGSYDDYNNSDRHNGETADVQRVDREQDEERSAENHGSRDNKHSVEDIKGEVRLSLKDSAGNILTREQQEYFKDSKVRDENGNLKVVYHGTRKADFTEFKRNVNFFTDSEEMADSYSPNGEKYKGYLNITKPYEIDAKGEKWSKVPIDEATKEFLQEYGASVFKEGGKWRTTPADIAAAIEEAVDSGELDYDGIIIKNIDDTGSYYKGKGKHLGTDYITFNSNQFKNADNTNPTSNPDIRFNLKQPVEETKDLVAVHNMQVSELERTLDLGGLPMPSIAIIKAQSGHSEYGDVSLVFDKSTIDPKVNKNNKVYGGDAWTPTYPKIEYKPNEKIADKISDKYYELSRKFGYDESRPLYGYVYELEEKLNRHNGEAEFLKELYDDKGMKQLYLLDSGKGKVEPIQKEVRTELSDAEVEMNEFFIKELGAEVVDAVMWDGNGTPVEHRKNYFSKYGDAIRDAYKKLLSEEYEFSAEQVQNVLDSTKTFDYLRFVRDAYKYRQNGRVTIKTEEDYNATQKALEEATGEEYRKWVDNLFKGVEEKSGIRNNTDYFTNSGNRRSWEALHWENNLENVVKVMKSQDNGVAALFSGHAIWAVSAKDYKSIEEIKADKGRLQQLPEEEYNKIKEAFGERFENIAKSIMSKTESNPFIAMDNAMSAIVEAVRNSKTKLGLMKNLQEYTQLSVTKETVNDIVSLVSDIANMPTEYFEAKPKRAVELNEIATAIIPDSTSEATKTRLDDMGIKYLEYEAGNEDARLEALNSLEEVRFSFSNDGNNLETQKKIESIAKEINSHDELVEVAKKNTQEFVDKIKENKSLQKRLKNAKRQMLLSPKPIINIPKVGKVTNDILKEMDSTLKATDLKDEIISIYTEYFDNIKKASGVESKTQEANDNMMKRFANLAINIAESAETYAESEEYLSLKSYLKDVRIKVPESAKSDVHYAEFRKSHMGTFNLTNDGLEMDVVYQELCEMFPGMLDENITHPADQLNAIADKYESLKPYAYNPHLEYMQDAVDHIVYRFASEVDGIAASPKTKAQKIAEKGAYDKEMALEKERASFERKLDKHKKNSENIINKLQKKIGESEYVRYWEKRLSKEEKTQAVNKVRERQKVAVLKTKIRNIVSDMKKKLDKTEKTGGYPKELVKTVAEVCSVLDFHTDRTGKDGAPTKASLKLDALKMQYDALKDNENYDFASEYDEGLSSEIQKLYNKVKDKRVIDLNATELSELKDILSEISQRLSNATKQIGIENAKENAAIGSEIIESLNSRSDVIKSGQNQMLREIKLAGQQGKSIVLNPHRINKMIAGYDMNSAWWELYDGINRGSRKASKFVMDATKPFDELTDGGGNEIAFYDFRTKNIKTGIKYLDGSEVEIPKSIICELVMMWDRKQGRTHLETGGAKIPDMTLYNKGKTTVAITDAGKRTAPITQVDIDRLKTKLDSYDKAWIEKAHYLFNNVSKNAINEVSMELIGRELAKEENYIRMYVDQDFIRREIDGKKEDATLESHGSLKETVPNAKQPVVLRGLHENVYDNIDFSSKYYGLAIPIRNFNKVYNIVISDGDGRNSVKELIGQKFGSYIRSNVVEQLIRDLQAPRPRNIEPFGKIRGKWLGATFWGNIRSALKQTTSYWTASSILDGDSLVKGLASYSAHHKQTKAEIGKYSGTLYKRSQGLSTTELGDRANRKRLAGASNKATKLINEHAPVLRKIPEWIRPGNWLQSMDCAVSSALWDACKHQVSKTMNVSDEGYMKAVTDLYERVIEETQSNYDVAHRPEALKNTNGVMRTITMFQTDNLQQSGILFDAYNDYKTKSKLYEKDKSPANEKAKDEAKKGLSKAIRSRVYSSLWYVFVSHLGNMLLRKFLSYIDDEEKEITSGSIAKQSMLMLCDDMLGVFVPVVGPLISKAADTFSEGYDFVTEPTFDVMEDFIKSTSKIWDAFTNDKDGDVLKAFVDAVPAISNMTGIPAKNIADLYKSVKGYAGDIIEGDFAHDIEDYTSGNKSFYSYGDLASSISSGDKEKEKKILDYYSANGKEFAKGSLTKEIKPAYVQTYIDFPEKANYIKRKLILDYDYSETDIDKWLIDGYLDNVVSDPEYAAEIKGVLSDENKWNTTSVFKATKSHYKKVYKDGNEKETKALREALLKSAGVSEGILTQWETEADFEIEKAKNKLDEEKEKFEE